ncbi:GNAT family N-acetyltransferase [Mycoplasmatota bacterium]|nr:GNAT family N-acetyltransferase [Mycoplasmatota bacterium]
MEFVYLSREQDNYKKQAALLLQENFKSYEKSDVALSEMDELLDSEIICIVLIKENEVIGMIGGEPTYSGNVWELHPLVIKKAYQHQGIGSKLLAYFEKEVHSRGGMTIYLGSDDEDDLTSLSNRDIYENLYYHLENIKNKNNHPFSFYQKNGYKIVGVVPDANGYGKPDIMMAKRIGTINK